MSFIVKIERLLLSKWYLFPYEKEEMELYLTQIRDFIQQNSNYNFIPLYLNLYLQFFMKINDLFGLHTLDKSFDFEYERKRYDIIKYGEKKLNEQIRWVLKEVFKKVDYLTKSKICYLISKMYVELRKYNKAQVFAIRAYNYLFLFLKNNNYSIDNIELYEIYLLRIYLLISKIAFYKRKFEISYGLLEQLVNRIIENDDLKNNNLNISEIISILLESLILMAALTLYQKYDLNKTKEILSTFLDITKSFLAYVDLSDIKSTYKHFIIKTIELLWKFEKNNAKFLESIGKKRRYYYNKNSNKGSENQHSLSEIRFYSKKIYNEIENLYDYKNFFKRLYNDYIIRFEQLYPDNYELAMKYALKAFYIANKYLFSSPLMVISKFLAFKVLDNQQISNDIKHYFSEVDISKYIENNDKLIKEINEDISNKVLVMLKWLR